MGQLFIHIRKATEAPGGPRTGFARRWLRTGLFPALAFFALCSLFYCFDRCGGEAHGGSYKVLRICDSARDSAFTLDPHLDFEPRNRNIVNQIFERFLEFDVDGNPAPNIAKSWRRIDRNTVQFKLNRSITFHNGEPCDAHAIKFSLERAAKLNSPGYYVLKSIQRVDVLDSYTVNIVTAYSDGILINRLCEAFIVPPRYITQVGNREFEKHPIGTGPFKFVTWERGKELVLEKNAKYWRPRLPNIDRLVFRFADARQRVDMLLAGQLDFITNFEPSDLQRIEKQGFKTMKEASFTMMAIYFNLRKEKSPFLDKRVRKAANYAVDKDELIKKVKLGHGIARGTMGMAGEFGYNPYIRPYPYDPGKAKNLLREAGYPDGFTAKIHIDDVDGGIEGVLAKELKGQLAKVGIKLIVEAGNAGVRITSSNSGNSRSGRDFHMIAKTIPDPLGHIIFLEGMLSYDSESPWSLLNSPKLDQLYNKIIRTLEPSAQAKLCQKLEEMVHEECYSLFAYQEMNLYAMQTRVVYDPYITGMIAFRETEIR